jgi:hypothetical protein
MQYLIHVPGGSPDVPALERALAAIDASVLADFDASAGTLRISTWLDSDELVRRVGEAGYQVYPENVKVKPSECCGGCGG